MPYAHFYSHINIIIGSAFRTRNVSTAFFYQLCRHADVYTSSVNNFFNYPLDYCFTALRQYFTHERKWLPEHARLVEVQEGVDLFRVDKSVLSETVGTESRVLAENQAKLEAALETEKFFVN